MMQDKMNLVRLIDDEGKLIKEKGIAIEKHGIYKKEGDTKGFPAGLNSEGELIVCTADENDNPLNMYGEPLKQWNINFNYKILLNNA
jgi:hypothetical protein